MKVYLYCVEDQDDSMLRLDERPYPCFRPDCVYADLESARERMRMDYLDYRTREGKDDDEFRWTHDTEDTWECIDENYPVGWKIVGLELNGHVGYN